MQDECSICLGPKYGEIAVLDCNHTFHLRCIQKWLCYDMKNSVVKKYLLNKCPMCITGTEIISIDNIEICNKKDKNENLLIKVFPNDDECKETRTLLVKQNKCCCICM